MARYDGFVEKFVGDAVMAMFGATVLAQGMVHQGIRAVAAGVPVCYDLRQADLIAGGRYGDWCGTLDVRSRGQVRYGAPHDGRRSRLRRRLVHAGHSAAGFR